MLVLTVVLQSTISLCICIVLTVDLQSFFVYIRIIAGNRNRHGPVKSIVIDFSDYRLLISDFFCSVNMPSLVAIWNVLKAIMEPVVINLFPSDYRL